MCTAATYKKGYYGRNLDLEFELNKSKVVITPRNYKLEYRVSKQPISMKFGMVGMAMVVDNYPLYYDAMNEHGLYMAGLNFNGYAKYFDVEKNKDNITPFELIPHILGQCKTIAEVKKLLDKLNLIDMKFNETLALTPLHWIVADENQSIVIESTVNGLNVYDNDFGVLTNNPEFSFHKMNVNNYMFLSPHNPKEGFCPNNILKTLSHGIGTTGLPGGLGSTDRFIRTTYNKMTSVSKDNEVDDITQLFHILGSVNQVRGSVFCFEDHYEITFYTSCCSKKTKSYYYRTYTNAQLSCVKMDEQYLNDKQLKIYDLVFEQQINYMK